MKEPSAELSMPKGAGALSAGVSQSLSKSPIYIKMHFQTCFNFTFPLSSPSTLPPHLAAPLSPRHLARWRGPSGCQGERNWRKREQKALNSGKSRNRSWSRSSGSADPFSCRPRLGGRPGDGAGRVPTAGTRDRGCRSLCCCPGSLVRLR